MPTFGHISEFVVEDERISAYLERVELYFGANDIAPEKKGSYLSECDWREDIRGAEEFSSTCPAKG